MRMIGVLALSLLAVACGGDSKKGSASEVASFCNSQCKKLDACGDLEGLSVQQCASACKGAQSEIEESDCKFTSAQVNACLSALDKQTCDEARSDETPEACEIECD